MLVARSPSSCSHVLCTRASCGRLTVRRRASDKQQPHSKLINAPEDVVKEMLQGLAASSANISLLDAFEDVRSGNA